VDAPGADQWQFERWAADARARDAADSRVRERWLRQQAREESTLAGILLRHAEKGEAVVVTTTAGRRHQGTVAGVGEDFVALRPATGHVVLVPMTAVAEVRVAGSAGTDISQGAAPPEGCSEVGLAVTLADLLNQAAGHRPRLALRAGEVSVVGDLESVGVDVLSLTLEGTAAGVAYVRLASVSDISLFASG